MRLHVHIQCTCSYSSIFPNLYNYICTCICRGQECGPFYVVFFMHFPAVVALKPEDIKVHMHGGADLVGGGFRGLPPPPPPQKSF
jgi:hypothetical protein